MGLYIYTLNQADEWDKIVRSFKDYDIYWLSGYVKAFCINGDGEPLLFYYYDAEVRGINVVMRRDVAKDLRFRGLIEKDTYYDTSTPYGYGGWLIEGCNTKKLFDEYKKWNIQNGIVSEFVRFHPLLKNHLACNDIYNVVALGKVVCMDLSSQDVIWSNLTSQNRNMIRKAQKNGIKVFWERKPEIYSEFQRIYEGTMRRNNAEEYYFFGKEFYNSLMDDLPYNAQVFYAVYNQTIIAAAIMLSVNGKMNYHLSGSIREYASLAPTNLILYEAALWGAANGYKSLYLGGGVGSGEDGLYKFKKSFNRNDNCERFHIGKFIYDEIKYNKLCELVSGRISNDSFFPHYRG